MTSQPPSYRGYRFPSEIISHAVWLYYRFGLSFRDVEDLLAERGITVTYEAIRLWCRTFGLNYARRLRRRRGRQGDTWYLDELFVKIQGQQQYLWRAVDVEDETERQGGFDGEIGILELPAPPADASRCPRGDRVGREPEGDVASPHEGSVVLGPVPDAIRCRVLRMHSRLHIEIMTRRRSRWSTCRPLLAHRAESAHQRLFFQRRRPSCCTNVIVRSRAGDRGPWPETVAVLAGGMTTVAPRAVAVW